LSAARSNGDAIVVTVALLVILVALRPLERRLHHEQHAVVVQLDPSQKLGDLIEVLDEARIEVEHLERNRDDGTLLVTFRGSRLDYQRLLDLCGAQGFSIREDRPATSSLMAGSA